MKKNILCLISLLIYGMQYAGVFLQAPPPPPPTPFSATAISPEVTSVDMWAGIILLIVIALFLISYIIFRQRKSQHI